MSFLSHYYSMFYFDTNLCPAQVTDETLQTRPPITKKHHGRNKIRRINNQFVAPCCVREMREERTQSVYLQCWCWPKGLPP